ncbi:uncharacterized protein LOC134718219 [Mytilus trossulus]|uniref:uncharacterized protein LOC134718219 n=1 Tax=Mytilus trossulus TaxID=6551 RepID=UPI0030045D48
MSHYGSWTLPELKKELKTRGARVSGRKRELIERLESYDRNQNFGKETAEDEFNMTLPSSSIYKDVNSETDFSNFTSKSIDIYLEPMGKTLDTKAKQLYNNRFLKYLRLGTENDFFFVKSECHAEMKRKITYKVDVCINKELTIMEAKCECAAGMGPTAHCKHVCAVLFGMTQFSCFKELRTEETCTQRLQTFHQCKPFSGSPIKAQKLPISNEGLNVSFDPRPEKFRSVIGYNDYFRNICLNHSNIGSFPISHLFQPANLYAVAVDHDYFKLSPEDHWLKDNKLFQISDEDIISIQALFREQLKFQEMIRKEYLIYSVAIKVVLGVFQLAPIQKKMYWFCDYRRNTKVRNITMN